MLIQEILYQNSLEAQTVFKCHMRIKRVNCYKFTTYLMQQVIEVLKQHEAASLASLQEKDIILIEKRPGNAEPHERRRQMIEGTISNQVSEEKFNDIMLKLDELNIMADISQALPNGGPFGDYGEIENVFDEGKTHLKHEAGEVLLVDVWATWCGPCQRPMQHNQDMLVKNEAAWAGKVRITAVSVDDTKETIVGRVNGKGWNKIQHLTLLGWKGDHKLIKDFNISGIPFVCLVDKFGKINFTGHPSSIKLEDRINQLIAQEKEESEPAPAAPAQNEAPQENKLSALLTAANIKATFPNVELLCFRGSVETTYEKGVQNRTVELQAYTYQNDHATQEKVKDVFHLPGVTVKVTGVKTVEVPHQEHPTCWECHAALQFPYYWLKWEEGAHFACRTCIEKPSTVEGHHWHYEKNAVLLTGKWERIPVKGFGNNLQPQKIESVESGHGFGCNGCGGSSPLGQARYICLGCRADPNFKGDFVDLCPACLEKVVSHDQWIKDQLKNENHGEDHPILRVLYNVKGYYEF